MLTEDGEINATHKTAHPYSKWEIEKLAEEQGLSWFSLWDYERYVNRRGSGAKCNGTFPIGEASTYKFSKYDRRMHCANALLNFSSADLDEHACQGEARLCWALASPWWGLLGLALPWARLVRPWPRPLSGEAW
ncbi:hypothetical protein NL676_025497 [Syzygium grande]|nr:hypothetical protein NL676_025497 [Syzygium grande]